MCANALRQVRYANFEKVLKESRQHLAPFGEPLEQDFGLYYVLETAREESYSNWLGWLCNQMSVAELADVLVPELRSLAPDLLLERVTAVREWRVEHGHQDRTGRIDLLIEIGLKAVVVVEVKLGHADNSDFRKNNGYVRSITEVYPNRQKFFVFLVKGAGRTVYEGFVVRTYAQFCRNIRRLVSIWSNGEKLHNPLTIASVLMVVGAIEMRLLGLSAMPHLFTEKVEQYLSTFVNEDQYE